MIHHANSGEHPLNQPLLPGDEPAYPGSSRPTQVLLRLKPRYQPLAALLLFILLLSSCSGGGSPAIPKQVDQLFPSITTATPNTATPFLPAVPTPTPTVTPTCTPVPFKGLDVWLDSSLPPALLEQIHLPKDARRVTALDPYNLQVGAVRGGPDWQITWVYALVAPFPTLTDGTSREEIEHAWRGEPGQAFTGTLLVSPSTRAAFEMLWGPSSAGRLEVLADQQLLDRAWSKPGDWALIPFEDIEPRWKVLTVDGLSLFDKQMDLKAYPLKVWFGAAGDPQALSIFKENLNQDSSLVLTTNYDPEKLTVLAMTGVTALARATGFKMDTLGTTYPARDIQGWLRNADLTHISNEVSFNPECPLANPNNTSTMFCSRPEYIELLDFIGTDIVELSGNHNNDYGRKAFSYSLDLYQKRGWHVYGGGATVDEARKPAKIEVGNLKLAFTGCNPVGPPGVWATEDQPGVADCGDYQWLMEQISSLRAEGYLPIVTFQYFEIYVPFPSDHQQRHFREAVDAGAIIVSGSQAHYPQDMEFYNNSFIHFGLGNLFFDQMDVPVKGTRREFIDRHIFYDGRYINTELLTALLEDYARPRPMTVDERQEFLTDIFTAAGW